MGKGNRNRDKRKTEKIIRLKKSSILMKYNSIHF